MDYYRCPNAKLTKEIQRRGFQPYGDQDQLSEGLQKDDSLRGSEATTVETVPAQFVPSRVNLMRTVEFGKTAHANILVGERIVHWTMNTFFPTLQLFFESGRSCTIEGGQLSNAAVGLDPQLRFRLTDITHEEDGRLIKTTLPEKLVGPSPSIAILEATIACRTSVAVKQTSPEYGQVLSPTQPRADILQEKHMVVGLRLEGMKRMGYLWAREATDTPSSGQKTWGDMRVTGLRDDIPVPFFGFPQKKTKFGGEMAVVEKRSMIRGRQANGILER
ncbi:hypothetical protein K458DRAFT_117486 [Lentithecium fluviatile CBS 122367]|uniref:Uncharacterized protein n=1 Tax=Lentithecium fluviatile CBS 122367 TaxID=1168545 RepID=A0A6G1IMV5_9PLEO|nr:hypothetical protein K458DRAFT_117486 [Lentithecium fluviatile CBS 122367]